MNSKECLNAILDMLNYEQIDECEKNNYLKTIKQDLDKLEQLEKALDILKNRFEIESIYKDDMFYAIDCKNTFYLLSKEEYELLKEVFGNEN